MRSDEDCILACWSVLGIEISGEISENWMVVVEFDEEEEGMFFISANTYQVIVENSGLAKVALGIIDAGSNI